MKAPTKTVEIQGIKIAIPVGSMDKPTPESERTMKEHEDPRGWKYPIQPYVTYSKSEADDLAYCYNWYLGGHERETRVDSKFKVYHIVSSKGYYHYIGA